MRHLSLLEVLDLHGRLLDGTGGAPGLRDFGALLSALAQPRANFGDHGLYPRTVDKLAALGFGLIHNHPFVDGNKRIAHLAMVTTAALNGLDVSGSIDDHSATMWSLAAGEVSRDELVAWLEARLVARQP